MKKIKTLFAGWRGAGGWGWHETECILSTRDIIKQTEHIT